MNLRSVYLVAALAAATLPAHAVVTTQWDFETSVVPSAGTTWAGIASSTGVGTASVVHSLASTYSAPAGNGSAHSISSNTWTVGDYYQFAFSMTGYSGLSISFDQTGSSTGPASFSLAYSTNGTTFTSLPAYTVPTATWNATTPMSISTLTTDLSGITALNNQSSVYIRLIDASTASIGGGTVASGGTDRVDNFTVSATPAVPEPETYALMAAGLGAIGFVATRRKA